MGFSLGGLGLMSLPIPFFDFVAKGDLRSMFCLIVFLIVFFVLAYLTNPSENSFRAYLTEQSFRLHLSRLDDGADDTHSTSNTRPRFSATSLPSSSVVAIDNSSLFHFANRASIGLRTPKHVFHRFAIFTVAAMVPLSKSSEGDNSRDGWMISDSWYIGAFGKWWRGGVLEAWYQDVIARSKDEESWSSGILSMKRLDIMQDYDAPSFTAKSFPTHLLRASPPRLRNRERPTLRHNNIQPRSQTPPPLPKSVSLPMHTSRKSSNSDRICDRSNQIQAQLHAQPCMPTEASRRSSLGPSRTPSALFEHSPLIKEVLHQIANTKSSVNDLRTQLSECTSSASQSHSVLQLELDIHRDRKRQEDASKIELKMRTKALEDSKRGAESLKKEAEKRLKNLQSARDGARQRMDHLDEEISGLQQSLSEDKDFIERHRGQVSDVERSIALDLEQKRLEIKTAEDALTVLNQRSRELEEKLASEKERLKLLRGESDRMRRQFRASADDHPPQFCTAEDQWNLRTLAEADLHSPHIRNGDDWDGTSMTENEQFAYDPGLPNSTTLVSGSVDSLNDNKTMISLQPSFPTLASFLPFNDLSHDNGLAHSVRSAGITDGFNSEALQSDSDSYSEMAWRSPQTPVHNSHQNNSLNSAFPMVTSPSLHRPTMNMQQPLVTSPGQLAHNYVQDRNTLPSPTEIHNSIWGSSEFDLNLSLDSQFLANGSQLPLEQTMPPWFSQFSSFTDNSNKGLNPGAKEFSLSRKLATTNTLPVHHPGHASYDALNPNGLGTMSTSTSSSNQSLLRAFAPSPAEREALHRALGGSANASLERLPSLSDVGSIPASPTNSHAVTQHIGRGLGSMFPAWIQTLPRGRKVNFSPWEDEEPSSIDTKAPIEQKT